MELILLTNLAFSVVGFVFILRMWKEVKERRDYYGEHFGIPRGEDMTNDNYVMPTVAPAPVAANGVNVEQVTAEVMKAMGNQKAVDQTALGGMSDGDLQRIIQMVAQQQGGA